jgi:hypothetical protein
LSNLDGAEKALATFSDNSTVTSSKVIASDPANDIAVLDSDGYLPLGQSGDQTIKWQYMEKIHVIPGPGMPDVTPELTAGAAQVTRSIGAHRGEHPAGFRSRSVGAGSASPVLDDPSGRFYYAATQERSACSRTGAPQSFAKQETEWLKSDTARGLMVRG